jgi:uncharacterized membrane protein
MEKNAKSLKKAFVADKKSKNMNRTVFHKARTFLESAKEAARLSVNNSKEDTKKTCQKRNIHATPPTKDSKSDKKKEMVKKNKLKMDEATEDTWMSSVKIRDAVVEKTMTNVIDEAEAHAMVMITAEMNSIMPWLLNMTLKRAVDRLPS